MRPSLLPERGALGSRIPAGHPRIFFRPGDFDRVRANLDRQPYRDCFESIRARAFRTLERPVPVVELPADFYRPDLEPWDRRYPRSTQGVLAARAVERTRPDSVVRLNALTYRLTGEKRCLEHARGAMAVLAGLDLTATGYANTHSFNGVIPTLAVGLDYLWDELDEGERSRASEALLLRSREFHRLANPIDDAFDNHRITYGPPNLVQAGLALYGRHPEAESWLWDILVFFDRYWPPFGGDDGGWGNSLAYGEQLGTQAVMHALFVATGVNYFEMPWTRNNGRHLLYFQPPYDRSPSFGDASYDRPKGLHRQIMQNYAQIFQNPYYQWYADQIAAPLFAADAHALSHFLYWPRRPDPRPPSELPQAVHLADTGWVAMHGNLASANDSVMLQFKSSRFGSFNHSHADQNSFILSAFGRPLLIDSGYYPWYGSPHDVGWTRQTIAHNALLVNGKGQGVWNRAAAGRIAAFATSEAFDYVAGDATAAYREPSAAHALPELSASREDVTRVVRQIVFVRPLGSFVLLDEVTTERLATIQILFHALGPFDVDEAAHLVRLADERAVVRIHLLEPGPVEISQSDRFTVPPETSALASAGDAPAKQWHVTCAFPPRAPSRRLVTVIVVTRRDREGSTPLEVARLESDGWLGASIGRATVEFEPRGGAVRCRMVDASGRAVWFEYSRDRS